MKAIVFDMAAVLFEWQPRRMLQRVLPHLAPDETAAAAWEQRLFEGWRGDWLAFDCGHIGAHEIARRIHHRTGVALADAQAAVDAIPHELQPIGPTVALLHRLADAGHRLFYLSNMPAPYVPVLEQQAFFARFSGGIWSGRVGLAKPDAAIFALAEQRFGAAAGELVFIDDRRANIEAARACGWGGVVFENAAQAEVALQTLLGPPLQSP
jgi:putative hydrolase of the HAD superfamily